MISFRKKIYLNRGRKKYCIIHIFKNKKDMCQMIKKVKPGLTNVNETLGMHMAYVTGTVSPKGKTRIKGETGTIFLNANNCGAGIVTHEIMHAILWAHNHSWVKKQYPIIIKSMAEEERILYNFTYAVKQFYNWFFKIENQLKK